ncbi:MAG: hypothetical protein COA59_15590 [Colwellia sp.]|nr:MAG: hypothetical protein COA59_15590 [Colwellia sp.]
MRYLTLIIFLFLPFSTFAAVETVGGISGFFSQVMNYLHSIADFFLNDIPLAIVNFQVYVFAWLLKYKLESTLWAINQSMSIATTFLGLISYTELLNTLVSHLPNDVKAVAGSIGIFQALSIIIEAYITKFIYAMFN